MLTTEIAERTGKRHDNVMRDACKMLEELHKNDDLKFEAVYRAGNGEDRPCYRLPKRELMVLLTGYSVTLRAAAHEGLGSSPG